MIPIAPLASIGIDIGKSTLLGAENIGRACRGVELDPLYVDVIIRRYETATGNRQHW